MLKRANVLNDVLHDALEFAEKSQNERKGSRQ